jgi:AraC-like DNA-binding protein
VPTFIHGHTWRAAEGLQGLRISSAFEHHTLSPKNSNNYNFPTWALLYIYEGGCIHSHTLRERTYLQTPSQALLFPPNVDRHEQRIGRNMSHAAYILFHDSNNSHLNRLLTTPYEWILFDDDENKTLGSLIKECAAVGYKTGELGFWKAQAILCRIINLLLASRNTTDHHYDIAFSGNIGTGQPAPLSSRVDVYLHSKLDRAITLINIAEELGISVSTLTHQYQKETGISPMAAFARKKMERIKELLKRGYPVKTIALQMSFPDSSGLSKFFKRYSGLSPREFSTSGSNI